MNDFVKKNIRDLKPSATLAINEKAKTGVELSKIGVELSKTRVELSKTGVDPSKIGVDTQYSQLSCKINWLKSCSH